MYSYKKCNWDRAWKMETLIICRPFNKAINIGSTQFTVHLLADFDVCSQSIFTIV
jgi:hypothetical protein